MEKMKINEKNIKKNMVKIEKGKGKNLKEPKNERIMGKAELVERVKRLEMRLREKRREVKRIENLERELRERKNEVKVVIVREDSNPKPRSNRGGPDNFTQRDVICARNAGIFQCAEYHFRKSE